MDPMLTWALVGRRDDDGLVLEVDEVFTSVAAALAALDACREDLRAAGTTTGVLLDRARRVMAYDV